MSLTYLHIVQIALGVIKFIGRIAKDNFETKLNIMKTIKPKKLDTRVITICDFKNVTLKKNLEAAETTGTDPTNQTITTITTVNTGIVFKS